MNSPQSDRCRFCDQVILLFEDDTLWMHSQTLQAICLMGLTFAMPAVYEIPEEP